MIFHIYRYIYTRMYYTNCYPLNMGPEEESGLPRTHGSVVMLVGGRVSGPLGHVMGYAAQLG